MTDPFPPLAVSVDLVAVSFAYDEGNGSVMDDLMRLGRGAPTRRQLAAQIAYDRQRERIERMQAGQLEEFAR